MTEALRDRARASATWRDWLGATRPATLSAAVVPVLVGSALGARAGALRPEALVLALVAAVLLQIGANFANDYFDHRSGADAETRRGPRRLIQRGLASPRSVGAAAAISLGLAAVAGLGIIAIGGWPIAAMGLASIAAAVGYTGGPLRYGYRGLGDAAVFLFFGPVAIAGTAYLHLGRLAPAALAASLPVACLVTAILVVNNLRDVDADRAARKRTLAVLLGPSAARREFVALVAGAYGSVAALVMLGALPAGAALALVTLPLALPLLRNVRPGAEAPAMNGALRATARLHLVFGLVLAVGLLIPL